VIAVTDWSDDVAVLPMSILKNCGSNAAGESTTAKSRSKSSA